MSKAEGSVSMSNDGDTLDRDFGESTLTTKGQVTLPSALRQAYNLDAGDRIRWRQRSDGALIGEPRKRRSIVDFARANPIRLGEEGRDLDALIDAAITEAMDDKMRRSRGG
jgi:bifunctional DNA-binding transcriptional regulator/antitoxin component of YhaV-PrlF toxin-antitoxin module